MRIQTTYKNLYQLVQKEIDRTVDFTQTPRYKDQLKKEGIVTTHRETFTDVTLSELVQSIQEILNEALPDSIIEGLNVTETSPLSNQITITSGKGSIGGTIYTLSSNTTITIPFNEYNRMFFVNLFGNGIQIETTTSPRKLLLARIIVPNPGVTSRVRNTNDRSYDAYIVMRKEYKLYGDANDKFEEDTVELLRNNILPILSSSIIGTLTLSENLKITNTQGTLVLDSESLQLKDTIGNIVAKFNRNGTFFYNTSGQEVAKFSVDEARVGNIVIKTNAIQSGNFVSGTSGFRIKDDGSVEFSRGTFRGTLSAPDGTIGGFTITSTKLYGGIIQTGVNVGVGQTGVIMDSAGLRGYDAILGNTFKLPTDGSSPSFSSGIISETVFEINANAVLRTSATVGNGSVDSAGILINNTGLYGCEANQLLANANLKALINGTVKLKGEIISSSGQIGNVTITSTKLSGGLIEGATLRGNIIETASTPPRVRLDSTGFYYQVTGLVGKYRTFKYGDGTRYGTGVLAFFCNPNYPPVAIVAERGIADFRLYNRLSDPGSGTGPHKIGDLIVVQGKLKICTVAGSPGTFTIVGTQVA